MSQRRSESRLVCFSSVGDDLVSKLDELKNISSEPESHDGFHRPKEKCVFNVCVVFLGQEERKNRERSGSSDGEVKVRLTRRRSFAIMSRLSLTCMLAVQVAKVITPLSAAPLKYWPKSSAVP